MKPIIKRMLKAGWTIIKWSALAGGAILLTFKAPTVACMLGALPVAAYISEKTQDAYLTMIGSAAAGMVIATVLLAAPEVAAVFTAFGLIEMKKRWARYIMLRKAQERAAQPA